VVRPQPDSFLELKRTVDPIPLLTSDAPEQVVSKPILLAQSDGAFESGHRCCRFALLVEETSEAKPSTPIQRSLLGPLTEILRIERVTMLAVISRKVWIL
jgi:hypothetical protein